MMRVKGEQHQVPGRHQLKRIKRIDIMVIRWGKSFIDIFSKVKRLYKTLFYWNLKQKMLFHTCTSLKNQVHAWKIKIN